MRASSVAAICIMAAFDFQPAQAQSDVATCEKTSDPAASIESCTRLIQANSGGRFERGRYHSYRALSHYRLKNHAAAIRDATAALQLDPQDFLAYSTRGSARDALNQFAAAIADFSACMRVDYGNVVCRYLRAIAYSRSRQHAVAVREFTAVLLVGEQAGIDLGDVYAHRGLVYDALGQRQSAINDYREALRRKPHYPGVQQRLAALEAGAAPLAPATGDPDRYRQACFNPPNPQAGIVACTRRIQAGAGADAKEQSDTYNSRAWWRYKAGQNTTALADANRAIALDPGSAPAYDTRGHIHSALGRRDDAIRDFRQALALNPRADTRRSAREGLRALGVAVSHPPGTPVNLTWRFRNNSGGTVHVKMYARDRGIWWPGATRNWRMDGVGPYAFTISCRAGEKVCYGAWQSGNTELFWGTGFEDRNACDGCCYSCFEGQTTVYSLNR